MERKPPHILKHKGVIGAVIVLLILIFGMAVFAYLERIELESRSPNNITTSNNPDSAHISKITAEHYFIDGRHTLIGEITFPTSCEILNWNTSIAESYPEQVTVNFSTVSYTSECAPAINVQPFQVEFEASENASIRAQFNKEPIELEIEEKTLSNS